MMQLLEHFKELTLHPKNAEELKGLILQLALQGKLTQKWREENPDVEPASVLLEKIATEKTKLVLEKKLKKEVALPALEFLPFEIPENWAWCYLSDLGLVGSSSRVHQKDWTSKGVPFYRAREIVKLAKFNKVDNELFISRNLFEQLKKNGIVPEQNDIMLTGVGTIGIPYVVNKEDEFYFKDASVLIFKNLFKVNTEYLNLFFKTPYWISNIHKESMGTTVHTLTISRAKMVLTVFPPLEEQKAIVATVNQLFAEVEQLEALTKERVQLKTEFVTSALNQLTQAAEQDVASRWAFIQEQFGIFFTEKSTVKKLRESILQLAVQGKLTHHWRTLRQAKGTPIESASDLLEKIKAEKEQLIKAGKIKKEKPLPEISEEEIPYELPEGWVWCRFQDIFDIRDGTHDSPKDAFGDDTFPLITSKNFKNGDINFDSARRISKEDYLKVIQRSQVHKGDILFSMIGGNIGNQVVVGDFTEYAIKNVALFKHYKYGLPTKGFLNLFSQYIALNLQGEAAGGAQPFVSLKYFRNLVLGLPQLEEQTAIVEKVNGLMDLCDQLEQEIGNHQTTQEQWMQSCLREVL